MKCQGTWYSQMNRHHMCTTNCTQLPNTTRFSETRLPAGYRRLFHTTPSFTARHRCAPARKGAKHSRSPFPKLRSTQRYPVYSYAIVSAAQAVAKALPSLLARGTVFSRDSTTRSNNAPGLHLARPVFVKNWFLEYRQHGEVDRLTEARRLCLDQLPK